MLRCAAFLSAKRDLENRLILLHAMLIKPGGPLTSTSQESAVYLFSCLSDFPLLHTCQRHPWLSSIHGNQPLGQQTFVLLTRWSGFWLTCLYYAGGEVGQWSEAGHRGDEDIERVKCCTGSKAGWRNKAFTGVHPRSLLLKLSIFY